MTGFGSSSAPLAAGRVVVEVRSINARALDVRMRVPELFGDATLWAEQLVRARLRRGRVEVTVTCEGDAAVSLDLDRERALAAMRAFADLAREIGSTETPPLSLLASVPGLFVGSPRVVPEAKAAATQALVGALVELEADRSREGRALADDMLARVASIQGAIERVRGRAAALPSTFRARLAERLGRLGPAGVDPTRLEVEVTIAADRCDVSEELCRLSTHVGHFKDIVVKGRVTDGGALSSKPPPCEPEGRRLDFLLQEAMREATTLAVKAQDATISADVVEIKVELERMREQVQNVE